MSGFETVMGTSPLVFLGITLIFMGGCSFMSGQALAATWRPAWQAIPYSLLLGVGDRFLCYALFDGQLFLASGYAIDSLLLMAISLITYRITQARMMATQYPWQYERAGLFGWRERAPHAD